MNTEKTSTRLLIRQEYGPEHHETATVYEAPAALRSVEEKDGLFRETVIGYAELPPNIGIGYHNTLEELMDTLRRHAEYIHWFEPRLNDVETEEITRTDKDQLFDAVRSNMIYTGEGN